MVFSCDLAESPRSGFPTMRATQADAITQNSGYRSIIFPLFNMIIYLHDSYQLSIMRVSRPIFSIARTGAL